MPRLTFAGGGILSLAIGLDHCRADRGRSRADAAQPGRPVVTAGRGRSLGRSWPALIGRLRRCAQKSTLTRTPTTSAFFNGTRLSVLGIPAPGLKTYCRSGCSLSHGVSLAR
jgi:hypothetical protein